MTDVGAGALRVLAAGSPAGRERLARLDRRGRGGSAAELRQAAAEIVDRVRAGGDTALLEAVRRFDGVDPPSAAALRLSAVDVSEGGGNAGGAIDPDILAAIHRAHEAVEAWHRSLPGDPAVVRVDRSGVRIEERRLPIRRVGLYVPGGRFPYPSTVLMTAVPARLAGVEEIVVATPPRAYRHSPLLRHVLDLVGVDEVWGMGGAHAMAALAYGTESVRPVDLIAGPGNAWVAAAKRQVAPDVGVDRDAGPSEVVVAASADAPAAWIAADLLAQAEHDPLAVAVLVTDSADLAGRVADEVDRQLAGLPTAETAAAALDRYGTAFVAADLDEAVALAERIAPEHLQLIGAAAEARADDVRNAGAVFVGASSPVVFGDYVAGPSHVLPTGGSARFASGLGLGDFVRRSHTVRFAPAAAAAWADTAETLAAAEGLAAHAAAARLRRVPEDAGTATSEAADRTHDRCRRDPPVRQGLLVRAEVRELSAYSLHQLDARYKLDQNEAPWDLPRSLKREALSRLADRSWAEYPDFHADRLRRLIGDLHDWPMEGVLVGNGSGELLTTVLDAVVRPGREVLICDPSFSPYGMFVRRAAGVPRHLQPSPDLGLQMDALQDEVARDPRRPVLLCTPNNPTGAAAAPAEVERLARSLDAALLLDNAYGEFCRHDYRPLVRTNPNVILFRTLSKAWSLGGVRLGYLLAAPELVAELLKVKLVYNVGHAAAVIGEVTLEHAERFPRRIAVVRARRGQWAAMLREFGFHVFDSEANFLLARHPRCTGIREGLAAAGILVRDVSRAPGLADCLRVGIGAGPALRATRRALDRMLTPTSGDSA